VRPTIWGRGGQRENTFFFLNPDTVLIQKRSLQKLAEYADSNPNAAVVAPRLIDKDGRYQWSANYQISLLQLIVDKPLAFIYRYLGQYGTVERLLALCSPRYEQQNTLTKIDRVKGAAMFIQADVFKQVGGFDENFFSIL